MVTVFPISINLSEVSEKLGQLSVPIICSAVEQELRDQGEVVRLVVVDARGQPIMDSSETRSKFFSYFCFICTLTVTMDLSCDAMTLKGVLVLFLLVNQCIVGRKMKFFSQMTHLSFHGQELI